MTDIACLSESLGYSFRDEKLLIKALTHTSYANEQAGSGHRDSNQRLEFLGDSVLGTVVSTYIYERFPDLPEGRLSRLRAEVVCEGALAQVADMLRLREFLLLGRGERQCGGADKPSILADAVEAVIAAVYLDGGFDVCTRVVMENLGFDKRIAEAIGSYRFTDHKTLLQERFSGQSEQVVYEIVSVSGPQHDQLFEAEARVLSEGAVRFRARGTGRSKKDAEQAAANEILKGLPG